MMPLELARKYRDIRYKAQEHVKKIDGLPNRIAVRLLGLNFDDMSTAEREIADLLGREGYLFFDKNGDCRDL